LTSTARDRELPHVTNEMLFAALEQTRPNTVALLRPGPKFSARGPDRDPTVAAIILEHGKRNYALRLAGLLRVVCPVADGSDLAGVGIFDATPEDVERILDGDPAIQADVLRYEVHPTRSFPASSLAPDSSLPER
jgi:hypothetical protein